MKIRFVGLLFGVFFLHNTTPVSSVRHQFQADVLAKVAERWKRQTAQINGNGQEDTSSDSIGCIIHCLTIIAKGALSSGQSPTTGTAQNPIESGSSLLCTKYDEHGLDEVCKSYTDGLKCFDTCADSAAKNITLNGFISLRFVCVERRKEFDKSLPCIGNSCAEAEQLCKPMCGMIRNETKDNLARSMNKVVNSDSDDWMSFDLFGIRKTIAENCRYATCYMNCSRPSLTAKCGEMAYSLYEELIWKLISAATHSFADIGLGSVWPDECKAFTAVYDVQHATTPAGVTPKTNHEPTVAATPKSSQPPNVPSKCNNTTCGQGSGSTSVAASRWTVVAVLGIWIYWAIHRSIDQ